MHRVEIRPANRLLRSFSVIFNAVNMFFIVLLVFFGLLFLVAELVLLPENHALIMVVDCH